MLSFEEIPIQARLCPSRATRANTLGRLVLVVFSPDVHNPTTNWTLTANGTEVYSLHALQLPRSGRSKTMQEKFCCSLYAVCSTFGLINCDQTPCYVG